MMASISRLTATPRARAQVPPVPTTAENAYYRAERRGFLPGFEVEDWLEAERELELAEHTGEMGKS